ncbi:MAG: hypothetical protein N4A47_06420 [Clostridia bacterium]|nr:hypothetical protein [Clostridia bacterium]
MGYKERIGALLLAGPVLFGGCASDKPISPKEVNTALNNNSQSTVVQHESGSYENEINDIFKNTNEFLMEEGNFSEEDVKFFSEAVNGQVEIAIEGNIAIQNAAGNIIEKIIAIGGEDVEISNRDDIEEFIKTHIENVVEGDGKLSTSEMNDLMDKLQNKGYIKDSLKMQESLGNILENIINNNQEPEQ